MITLIGNENCSQCELVKNLLKSKGVDFDYKFLNELENKSEYIQKARARNILAMPIIIKDDSIITLEELMNYLKTI